MEPQQSYVTGLHHIAIRAVDFDQTLNFYTKGLGYTPYHEWALQQFNLRRAAMLKSPDGQTYLEIFDNKADIAAQGRQRLDHEPFVQTALLHLCLSVTDVEKAYEAALYAGATVCIPPSRLILGNPPLHVHNALVYSPNGEVIEFIEFGSFE
ncbi:VOC family protein [Dyadobacter luteus]|uniref:VOC family protein n=1 Tax=Dyadobacter luteus TaxID=2259619 RepID=A0A3D8Y8J6_9BACT|nr:VOC family protein [Dyadobacter luteus]REA59661.1 VOC family protein [Dyadobacter luteus]